LENLVVVLVAEESNVHSSFIRLSLTAVAMHVTCRLR
jgi:hypothetical protein